MVYRTHIARGALVLIAIVALFLTGCKKQFDSNDFTVSMEAGFGNQIVVGKYAPLKFDVTNNSKDFEGTLQVIVPVSGSQNIMVEKQLSLEKNANKTVSLVIPVEVSFHKLRVCLADKKGDVIWDSFQYCSVATAFDVVRVGILSDDFNALGYMDRQRIWETNSTTRIYQLEESLLTEDWHALQMLDVIVVSDYSTELLTDSQMKKLSMWIENGGLLIVGTGSTAKKTLSKFNGDFFSITTGELVQRNTKFGIEQIPEGIIKYGNQLSYNCYDDDFYISEFREIFNTINDDMKKLYFYDFLADYYLTEDEFNADAYYQELYYTYCQERYYTEYYYPSKNESDGEDDKKKISESDYVNADILDLTWDACTPMNGTTSSGDSYLFAGYKSFGEGVILVCATDFTKNPLASYRSNSTIFVNMIFETIGYKISSRESNYAVGSAYSYGGYYYNLPIDDLGSAVNSANMPPIMFYFVLLILYLFTLALCFAILKRKKKTIRLWIAFPIAALAFGVLIYCFGFATRIMKPTLNIVTVSQQFENMISSKSLIGITVPKNKDYVVGISEDNTIDMLGMLKRNGYSFDESERNYDDYVLAFRQVSEGTEIRLNRTGALESQAFKAESVNTTDELISFSFSADGSNLDCELTNHHPYTVEDSMIVFRDYAYYIGDFAPGETVQLSDGSRVQIYSLSGYDQVKIADIMLSGHETELFFSGLFGTLSPSYRELKLRHALMEYCEDACLSSYSDDYENSLFTECAYGNATTNYNTNYNCHFFGFSSENKESNIQTEQKYREYSQELITAYFSHEDLMSRVEATQEEK